MAKNFPGNPYATDSHGLTTESAAIVKAITLLAFEVRTANLMAAARPSDLTDLTPEQQRRAISANTEARERLGRAEPGFSEYPQARR